MNATRRKAKPKVEQDHTRIAAGTTTGTYKPFWQPLRPNADQALGIPSRSGNKLYYRDGRVEELQ